MLIQFQPPAMCRVTNQQTRLPRATSSLALNACRDGASCCSSRKWVRFLLVAGLSLEKGAEHGLWGAALWIKPFLGVKKQCCDLKTSVCPGWRLLLPVRKHAKLHDVLQSAGDVQLSHWNELPREWWGHRPWRCSRAMEMWHWGTWAVGMVGRAGVGHGDLRVLFQHEWFHDFSGELSKCCVIHSIHPGSIASLLYIASGYWSYICWFQKGQNQHWGMQ